VPEEIRASFARDRGGERAAALLQYRMDRQRDLCDVLGSPLVWRATTLPTLAGGSLGPARGPDGRVITWGLWAPHTRVLLDAFRGEMPREDELQARIAFAESHGLTYLWVEPETRLSLDRLREVVKGGAAR
jgi:hypothetical protein